MLTLWQEPNCYFGRFWTDYYPVLSVTRDSGTIDRSNFRVAKMKLEYADKQAEWQEPYGAFGIAREKHFLCGWVETLMVHKDALPLVEAAESIVEALDKYPILCEEDHSRLEWEVGTAYWEQMSLGERIHACKKFRVSPFAARRDEVPSDETGELIGYLAS